MAFAVLAEGRAPGSGNARLLKEPGAESVAVDSKGSYAGKRVKGAARCAAGDAGNLIQRRDQPVPSLPESVPHPVDVVLGACYGCEGSLLRKRSGTGIGIDHQQLDTFCQFRMHDPVFHLFSVSSVSMSLSYNKAKISATAAYRGESVSGYGMIVCKKRIDRIVTGEMAAGNRRKS